MKKKPLTTEEFLEQLANDPDYQKRLKERREELDRLHETRYQETIPLLKELNAAGVKVEHIWDFMKLENGTYENAIPILMRHLKKEYSRLNINSIMRALAGADPDPSVTRELLQIYKSRKYKDDEVDHLICSAVASTCTIENLEEIKEILADDSYGGSRADLMMALVKLEPLKGIKKAITMIIKLLEEDRTSSESYISYVAMDILSKVNAYEARDLINTFTTDKRSDIRAMAKRVVKKFDKKLNINQ